MSFDNSRISFNPLKDYFGVVMQQGRVQLDADWNEMFSQIARRIQVETFDTFGESAVPRTTPNGFRISLSEEGFTIGSGRMYVAGKPAENHADGELRWDGTLQELSSVNSENIDRGAIEYSSQENYPLDFPEAPILPVSGMYLVYLDFWQRQITHLQDSELLEKAVGVDSTARMQNIWQVKVLPIDGVITAQTPDEDIPGWQEVISPSVARLSTSTGEDPDIVDLCHLPPGADYKGRDNHLYRVEIQQGGGFGEATFKWSRDNVTVSTRVTEIQQLDRIVVDSLGRDDYQRLESGDWIEITDNYLELHNRPGILRRIEIEGGIDDSSKTILLSTPLPEGQFPVDAQNRPDTQRNTRLKRWDQSASIRDGNGVEIANLDQEGSTGDIRVPNPGDAIFLDNGIMVNFDLDDVAPGLNAEFKTGDYWVFAARSADASVELLDRAPPQGIHHNYAKLAIVEDDAVFDLRNLWPAEGEQGVCQGTVCVSLEGHNDGSATIQQAIDTLAASGGGTVSLQAGNYQIQEPVRIDNGSSVTIRGKGAHTVLFANRAIPVIEIRNSESIVLENLTVFSSAEATNIISSVSCHNVVDLRCENCFFVNISSEGLRGVGLALSGYLLKANIEHCSFHAVEGISGPPGSGGHLMSRNLIIENCLFSCEQRGINFDDLCMHQGKTLLNNNLIVDAQDIGIVATGASLPESVFSIENNLLQQCRRGIRVGLSNLRLHDNDLFGDSASSLSLSSNQADDGDGIVIVQGIEPAEFENIYITGNRIKGFSGAGIVILDAVDKAIINDNQITDLVGAGLLMAGSAAINTLSLKGNHFKSISGNFSTNTSDQAVVKLQAISRGDLTNNTIEDCLRNSTNTELRAAIISMGSGELRIEKNRLFGLTPASYTGIGAGIVVLGNTKELLISDNAIQRKNSDEDSVFVSDWTALHVSNSMPTETTSAENIAAFAGAVLFQHLDDYFLMTPSALLSLAVSEFIQPNATIQNNQMNANSSRRTLLAVANQQHCLLSNNTVVGDTLATPSLRAVTLDAQSINVNNCYLLSIPGATTMNLNCQQFVVLGNTSSGEIHVNQKPLGQPWEELNSIILDGDR